MKKLSILLSMACAILLAGCFESTEEITLKADGSGIVTNTTDMSMLLTMAKGMGGDNLKDAGEKATDTTVSLAKLADSIPNITDEEKAILKKGKLGITVNLKDEKLITKLEIPFTKLNEVEKIKVLSSRVTQHFLSKSASAEMPAGMDLDDKMPSTDPLSEYFTTTYSDGVIEKKLDTTKYASVNDNESMKGLKEMSENGMPVTNTIIINLPRAAKKAEGKNVKLSDDKKKVTISGTTEDFFDNAARLEFRIEY